MQDPRPYILAECTWKEVRNARYDVAVLPWGATEAHNFHLPYATDIYETEHIAAEAGRRAWERGARLIILPAVPFGVNTGQLDIRLDMNLNPSTQSAVLRDMVEGVDRAGIRRMVVLNGHGGNDFRQMLRELQPMFPGTFLCTANWFQSVPLENHFTDMGDHAGEMETSLMMHVEPGLVRPLSEAGPGRAKQFRVAALREKWAWAQRAWSMVTEDTGVGDPRDADAVKGEAYFEAVCERLAEFFVDLAGMDPEEPYV